MQVTLRLMIGFFMASAIQMVFIVIAESIGLSTLNLVFSPSQLILHFLVGQAFGWTLYYIWRRTAAARAINVIWAGVIWGLMVWAVVLPFVASQGRITGSWSQGSNLIVSSTAFILYGMFSALVVRNTWGLLAH